MITGKLNPKKTEYITKHKYNRLGNIISTQMFGIPIVVTDKKNVIPNIHVNNVDPVATREYWKDLYMDKGGNE